MNLLDAGLAPVRRLMSRGPLATCFVCQRPILPSEERMRLRGDTVVHRRCATYRIRNRSSSGSRLGFPG
jgi:hypothetical protein